MIQGRLQRVLIFVAAVAACFCLPVRAGNVAMGVVNPDTPVLIELPFTNEGKTPVELGEITTGCDCLQTTQMPGELVAPGETIKLPFIYRGTKPGRVSITVLIAGIEKNQVLEKAMVSGFVTDPAWMISPAELLARRDASVVVVDIRRADRYGRGHLERSINIPLFAVKTRSDLHEKKVVLVDEGFAPDVLLGEVQELRTIGFKDVRMLKGGVVDWKRQGGRLEGLRPSALEAAKVTPAEVAAVGRTLSWQMLQADNVEEVLHVLAAHTSGTPLLIVAGNDSVYPSIEASLTSGMTRPVYYLDGGKTAWAAYEIMRTALAAQSGQTFQSKSTLARPTGSGGCGSCGK